MVAHPERHLARQDGAPFDVTPSGSGWVALAALSPWVLLPKPPVIVTSFRVRLVARTRAPFVNGELLYPVSPTSSTSTKPTVFKRARKSFPGIAPPSHLAQLATRAFRSSGNGPLRS